MLHPTSVVTPTQVDVDCRFEGDSYALKSHKFCGLAEEHVRLSSTWVGLYRRNISVPVA